MSVLTDVSKLMSDLDKVDASNINAGMELYAEVHTISGSMSSSVSRWIFRVYHAAWKLNECRGDDDLAKKIADDLEIGLTYIIDKLGEEFFVDSKGESIIPKLSGEGPLSAAHRKMQTIVKANIDLDEFVSVRAGQEEVARLKKEKAKAEATTVVEQRDKTKIRTELVEKNPDLLHNAEELEKRVDKEYAALVISRKAEADNARLADTNYNKHPIPKSLYTNEDMASAIQKYALVVERRMQAHIEATSVPVELAIAQAIQAIEGDVQEQEVLITGWQEKLSAAATALHTG